MSDIVKRLREMAEADYYGRNPPHFVPPDECADEIERLREALEQIATECSTFPIRDGLAFRCESIACAALEAKP
jgi:hypothetical protein